MVFGIQAFQAAFVITWIVVLSYICYLIYNRSKMESLILKLKK
ncbi:CcmD family protein [Methanococcoides sp. LMO-2]|uniref:CcmD family protein n=1 Tax=Methanococcoides cohabitans TaxID=3136559 RepID=A0ABU9KVC7_9EURY